MSDSTAIGFRFSCAECVLVQGDSIGDNASWQPVPELTNHCIFSFSTFSFLSHLRCNTFLLFYYFLLSFNIHLFSFTPSLSNLLVRRQAAPNATEPLCLMEFTMETIRCTPTICWLWTDSAIPHLVNFVPVPCRAGTVLCGGRSIFLSCLLTLSLHPFTGLAIQEKDNKTSLSIALFSSLSSDATEAGRWS